ncbi:hypothetical protein FRB90_002913 [Tulasnella sp. 427]|nr:hypothetical protein FRB90_002913 [Tulasnella sp. 427]
MGADSMPPEIWLEVFAATRDWRKVSKWTSFPRYANLIAIIGTCSRFHDIALPLLYEHAILRLDFSIASESQCGLSLLEIIMTKPERARWIKTLVGYWTDPSDTQENPDNYAMREMISTFVGLVVSRLPSLQVVHVDRPSITKALINAVLENTSIRTLSVHDVKDGWNRVPIGDLRSIGKESSIVQLRATSSTPFVTMQASYFLRIPGMTEITFTDYSLMEAPFTVNFWGGLEQLPWQNLRVLRITAMTGRPHIRDLDELCKFLEHGTNVEVLIYDAVLRCKQEWNRRPLPNPSTIMPKLKELYGPALMAPYLCEGKVVSKLGLIFHREIVEAGEDDVSTLGFVADTLRHLTIGNMETSEVGKLVDMFPLLESLEILPSVASCQRDSIPGDSDYIGQPRQEERSQLEVRY